MTRVRLDGSVTGSTNNPTTGIANGIWTLKDLEKFQRAGTWPTALSELVSTNFNYNSLLIHADGSSGSNNSVFVDSSPNAYTITRSGTPAQGTFTPFSQGWCAYIGGSSALTLPYSSTNFAFHTTDFTVEAWIYPTSYTGMTHGVSNIPTLIGAMVYNTTTADWSFGLTTSGILKFYYYNGSAISVNSSTTVPLNTWSHIAMTKTSSGISLFYNGSLVSGPTAVSGTPATTSTAVSIGGHNSTYLSSCYISNVRIVKGTALYSGSYTPSTTPLTAVTNTKFLGLQDNRFKDNSTVASAVTVIGTAASILPYSPFSPLSSYSTSTVGGSSYFNGSTDYLTLPGNMTTIGSSAYTLEGWFYPTTVAAAEIPLVKLYNATQTVELRIVSNKLQGRINNSATIVGGNSTLYPNQWYHFALVKASSGSSTATLYINGTAEANTATDNTTYTAFTTPRIGANQTPTLYYTGFASSVRIINGAAQYSGNFAIPTSPFTSSASVLALMNFTNAGIIDSTAKNNLVTVGSAALSSTQSKFGGTSMSFNGTTDYLTYPHRPGLSLLEADFTIEAWVYITSAATQSTLITFGSETTSRFIVAVNTSRQVIADIFGSATNTFTGNTITLNTWTHVAVVRSGSTITAYLNGTSVGTASSSASLGNATGGVTVGRGNTTQYFIGYIDDLRVTKGYARYTTNFIPPSTAFPDQ